MSATIIIGKRAVHQCLESGQAIEKVYVRTRQSTASDIQAIVERATKRNVPCQWLEAHRFDQRFSGDHQGIACLIHSFQTCSVTDIIHEKPSVVLVLDHIQDPHNFGAICRSAEAFGIRHICYPKDRAVQITPSVAKASAGAVNYITFCRVTNIRQTIQTLSKQDFWVYGASSNTGQSLNSVRVNHPLVLICGSEDTGISPALTKYIDAFIHIPLTGKTSSLNVSVATGIIIHSITP